MRMYAIRSKSTGEWCVGNYRYDSFEYENFDINDGVNTVIISHNGVLCFYKDDGYEKYLKEGKDHKVLWKHGGKVEVEVELDNVNQPGHYISHPSGIECIEITRHHDFAIGNAIKYLWRAGLKDSNNEVQDLEKAAWYIQDKIKQLKGGV